MLELSRETPMSQDPEQEARIMSELEKRFETWWNDEGSAPLVLPMDEEEHTRHISRLAWHNGAYVARSASLPIDAFTPPTYLWEVRDMDDQFQASGQTGTLHEAMSSARSYAYQYAPCKVRVWTEKTIHEATFDD